jgi:hypothetical protein
VTTTEQSGYLTIDPEEGVQPKGWLDCPKPPTKLPKDPKDKVLAVTEYLETCGMSLAEVAKLHPKWFYTQFLRPLLPKEIKADIKTEVLTDVQLDARIQHLVAVLGPEVVAKMIPNPAMQVLEAQAAVLDLME